MTLVRSGHPELVSGSRELMVMWAKDSRFRGNDEVWGGNLDTLISIFFIL